jgi:hypothetical protein
MIHGAQVGDRQALQRRQIAQVVAVEDEPSAAVMTARSAAVGISRRESGRRGQALGSFVSGMFAACGTGAVRPDAAYRACVTSRLGLASA